MTTPYHAAYYAHELTRRSASDSIEKLGSSLFNATVDPEQFPDPDRVEDTAGQILTLPSGCRFLGLRGYRLVCRRLGLGLARRLVRHNESGHFFPVHHRWPLHLAHLGELLQHRV